MSPTKTTNTTKSTETTKSSETPKARVEAIRVILVDDERLARKALRSLLKEHPSIEIVGEADGVEAAMTLVKELQPEVIFLDVQMSPLDGFALVNRLALQDSAPKIVFATAYDRYAVEAFEAHALDYLTKPVLPERLAKTVSRLVAEKTLKESANLRAPSAEEVHVLRDGDKVRIVRAREIHTVRAEGNYTRLQLAGGGTLMVRKPIGLWEASLPSEHFLKISKSLLINRSSIRSMDRISRDITKLRLADSPDPIILSRIESQRIYKALAKSRNP